MISEQLSWRFGNNFIAIDLEAVSQGVRDFDVNVRKQRRKSSTRYAQFQLVEVKRISTFNFRLKKLNNKELIRIIINK